MAAKAPLSAACCAAIGISNAPGTRTTVMSFGSAPALASAPSAPACSRSVTKSLNFETTSAKRSPAADAVPSIMRMSVNFVLIVCSAWRVHCLSNRRCVYRPVNCGFRFSRNARVPSRMSSVDAINPNKVASNTHASANGISRPWLIALRM